MLEPFKRGKAWFMYVKLEEDFLDTTSYVALESAHDGVWSERFGELLVRIGDMVDSFFRYMINSKSLDGKKETETLRKAIMKKRKENPNWHPDMSHFRKTLEPIFGLSSVGIEADYGLTYYGKLHPFKSFPEGSPNWWNAYNKTKHEIFEEIEKMATLENCINALAGLFTLNILHKESQQYLVRHTDVFYAQYMERAELERQLKLSMKGVPKALHGWEVTAQTPLFTHILRVDESVKGDGLYLSDEDSERY